MSKLTLTLVLLLGVALIMPAAAKAEVQNVKVSGDITIYGEFAEDFDLVKDNNNATPNQDSQGFYMSVTRVRVDADLTDNVAATIRLLNERDHGTEAATTNDVELDLAYVTLKEILYSPLTLTLGRQDLRFGNGLVLGDPDTDATSVAANLTDLTLSARKGFDAIRATLDFDPWTLDGVIVKIAETNATGNDHDLYGVSASRAIGDSADINVYYFADIDEAPGLTLTGDGEVVSRSYEEDDTFVLGIAGNIEATSNLILSGEVAYQFGEISDKTWGNLASTKSKDRSAWALDLGATYAFDYTYSPILAVGYSFRSGEESANNGDYEAWNPLYEDQLIGGLIGDVLLAGPANGTNGGVQNNAQIINVTGTIIPLEDVTLAVDYYHYILDQPFVNGSTFTNAAAATYTMTADDDAGDEVDIILTYDYTEDVQLGLTAGFFYTGSAFAAANNADASEILGSVKVSF